MLTRSDLISRARARGVGDGKPTVAARVDFVADLMEELEWDSRFHPWLAELWGLSEPSIHAHATEASRRVTGDAESARRDITAGARKLWKKAVDDEDAKAARAIGELWASVSGAKEPERHVVMAASGEVTPEMAARLVRESFGEKARPHADRDTKPVDPGEVPVKPSEP